MSEKQPRRAQIHARRSAGHANIFPTCWITLLSNQISLRVPRGPMETEIWGRSFPAVPPPLGWLQSQGKGVLARTYAGATTRIHRGRQKATKQRTCLWGQRRPRSGTAWPSGAVIALVITDVTRIQITVKEHFREKANHVPPARHADPLR